MACAYWCSSLLPILSHTFDIRLIAKIVEIIFFVGGGGTAPKTFKEEQAVSPPPATPLTAVGTTLYTSYLVEIAPAEAKQSNWQRFCDQALK